MASNYSYKRDDSIDPSYVAVIAQIAKSKNIESTKALKELYTSLGGSTEDISNCNTTIDMLNAIAEMYNGESNATNIPEAIKNIAAVAGDIGGGGSAPENDVNFYDYDGTIVNSYSKEEFANLSAMPSNPSHEGLTAQGWNWTIEDAKTYVANYGKLNIGQIYITSDGKTRIYIELSEGRLAPWLKLYLNDNSELDIDWGDGSSHSTFTTISADYVNEQHVYTSAGSYTITITVNSGGFNLQSSNNSISSILTANYMDTVSPDLTYSNSIKRIEIGNHVTSIGNYAFSYCCSLSNISIPSSVTNIGNYAFQYCYSLSSITIPSSVISIGSYTFSYGYSLLSIAIPNSVTSIGNFAFQQCSSLPSITVPSSVIQIGQHAFSNCCSLINISIPSSITSIGSFVFSDCYSLSNIIIPSSVTSIGSYAFSTCRSLSSITIPSSVSWIYQNAFQYCSSLSSIIINKPENSISGSPWGAKTDSPTSTQIIWTG